MSFSPPRTRSQTLRSRRSIHEGDELDESQAFDQSKNTSSPEQGRQAHHSEENPDSNSDFSGSEGDPHQEPRFNNIRRKSLERNINENSDNTVVMGLAGFLIIFLMAFGYGVLSNDSRHPEVTLDEVMEEFPKQAHNLWWDFKSGVQSVNENEQPISIILVYTSETEPTIRNLLPKLLHFASCHIASCEEKFINLTMEELNLPEVIHDFGILIEKYKSVLEEKGVMLVEHLEEVKGAVAPVFHTFCDEYTPFVKKSMFVFTMKVDKLPKDSTLIGFIEQSLKNKWKEIKPDTVVALITRISSVVHVIEPEETKL